MDTVSNKGRSLVQVYTGDGKGKTTAALGLAVRAAGAGLRTAIVFFDKGGDHYSERRALTARFRGSIDFFVTGLDRIDPVTGLFRFGAMPEDKAEAKRGLEIARGLLAGKKYDLVILDEIMTCIPTGLLRESAVMKIIRQKAPGTELVLTGRGCTEAIVKAADLVSEIRDVKHYSRAGVPAREGLDY